MQIRWNWGTKIFLAYGVFVSGMLGLVWLCTQQHFDLVRTDYYEAELAYQHQISGMENTLALKVAPKVTYDAEGVHIQLPADMPVGEAEVYFYKPDNARFDQRFSMNGDQLSVSKGMLEHGMYTIHVSWQSDGKSYFFEDKIFIQKQ